MREKTMKLVITFHTTTEAMAMERLCQETGTPGRLFPVPREISAGCGMAWCVPVEQRPALEKLAAEHTVCTDGWYELLV